MLLTSRRKERFVLAVAAIAALSLLFVARQANSGVGLKAGSGAAHYAIGFARPLDGVGVTIVDNADLAGRGGAPRDQGAYSQVPRGHAYFYTYPESHRLGSFETWRPKENINRSRRAPLAPDAYKNDDIFVAMLTAPSSIWNYVPVQLLTTLSHYEHLGLYSTAPESIAGVEVTDALAEIPVPMLGLAALEAYRVMRLIRSSHVHVDLSDARIAGADTLPRLAVLPMLFHMYATQATRDWYILTSDTTVLLTSNLRTMLAGLDPSEAYYLGSAVRGPRGAFADLASGIVLSRETMRRAFGPTVDKAAVLAEYTQRAVTECCGDYVLALYLRDSMGITLNIGASSGRFQGSPVSTVRLSARNWCKPIVGLARQPPSEVEILAEYAEMKSGRPILYSDIYLDFVKPYLPSSAEPNWDNSAQDVEYGPNFDESTKAHESLDECRAACGRYDQCLMLRYDAHKSYCGLGIATVSIGAPVVRYADGRRSTELITSEWFIDRIRAMRSTLPCDALHGDPHREGTEYGVLDLVEGWWHRTRRLVLDPDPLSPRLN